MKKYFLMPSVVIFLLLLVSCKATETCDTTFACDTDARHDEDLDWNGISIIYRKFAILGTWHSEGNITHNLQAGKQISEKLTVEISNITKDIDNKDLSYKGRIEIFNAKNAKIFSATGIFEDFIYSRGAIRDMKIEVDDIGNISVVRFYVHDGKLKLSFDGDPIAQGSYKFEEED